MDFLVGIGRLSDPQGAFEFVAEYVAYQIEQGVQSSLLLSNMAIAAYQRHEEKVPLKLLEHE